MTFEEDDFFYYLKVAQNLAHGAGSTYNGLVATNGYHPLWFWILTALSWFTTNPRVILSFVVLCVFLATLATYFLSRQIIAATGIGKLSSNALAVYVAIYASHIFFNGMEVLLTVPLVLLVAVLIQRTDLWLRGFAQSAAFGLLLCVMVLSRLDTAILVAMLGLACFLHPSIRSELHLKNIVGVMLGLLPLLFYFISNRVFFGTWLPVSGMAKQLKFNHIPSPRLWQSAIDKTPAQLLNYLPILLAFLLLPLIHKRLTAMQQASYPVFLAFPFVYIFLLSCSSDWGLFGWYYYPFRIALCIAFALFCMWAPTAKILRMPLFSVPAAVLVALHVITTHRDTTNTDFIYDTAVDVRNFSASHPGVYAMGDHAGKTGYLLPYPLVQTEGLMMDRIFLSSIRQELPLTTALAPYNVRYYVVTAAAYTGCFHADEPFNAGRSSPHMRAELCQPPVAAFEHHGQWAYIFDLQTNRH